MTKRPPISPEELQEQIDRILADVDTSDDLKRDLIARADRMARDESRFGAWLRELRTPVSLAVGSLITLAATFAFDTFRADQSNDAQIELEKQKFRFEVIRAELNSTPVVEERAARLDFIVTSGVLEDNLNKAGLLEIIAKGREGDGSALPQLSSPEVAQPQHVYGPCSDSSALDRLTPQTIAQAITLAGGTVADSQMKTIETIAPALRSGFSALGACTPVQIAALMGQFAYETGNFRVMEELASGEAYEGRQDLGNTEPGDGPRFKGRGLIQLVGRSNYEAYSIALDRPDILQSPELVATDPDLSVGVAIWYIRERGIMNHCATRTGSGDATCDIRMMTRRIVGGYHGLEGRTALFQAYLKALEAPVD